MAINDTRESVQRIVDELFAQGILTTHVEVTLERPKSREHGDYATNVALVAAKSSSLPPRELANQIAERLSADPAFTDVSVAGPGFVNIRLSAQTQGGIAERVVRLGSGYGRNDALLGKSFNVEFISANPTGPLHLGHTRWAAVGDALARVLAAAGADVTTEFYVNDRGVQMDKFGISVMAAASGEAVPEDGYHGGYILDLAAQINREHPEFRQLPAEEQMVAFREEAYALQWQQQKDVLELFRTHFDVWYSERKLYDSGAVER
ncbi:MAG: arginine--tRNA ligase domain-containing protein, partial [Candidatus Nanopelagicales bacterium]